METKLALKAVILLTAVSEIESNETESERESTEEQEDVI